MVRATAIRISEHERIRKLYQKSWDQKIHTKWAKHGFLVHKPPDIFLVSKNCSRTEVEFLIYKVDSSIRSGTLGICNQQDGCQLKGPKAQAAQQNADEFSWWSRLMRILIIRNHGGFFRHVSISKQIYFKDMYVCLGGVWHDIRERHSQKCICSIAHTGETFWYVVLGKQDDHLHCDICVMVYLYLEVNIYIYIHIYPI